MTLTLTPTNYDTLLREQRTCLTGIVLGFALLTLSLAGSGAKTAKQRAAAVLDRCIVLLLVVIVLGGWRCLQNLARAESEARDRAAALESFAAVETQTEERHPWLAAANRASPAVQVCPDVLVRDGSSGKFFLYNRAHPDFSPQVFLSLAEYMAYWREAKRLGNPCPVAFLSSSSSSSSSSSPDAEGGGNGRPQASYHEVELEEELRRAEAMELLRDSSKFAFYYPTETQEAREVDTRGDIAGVVGADPSGDRPVPLSGLDNNQRQGRWTEQNELRLRSMMGGYDVPASSAARGSGVGAGVPAVSANPMDPNWGGPEYTRQLLDEGYFRPAAGPGPAALP